MKHLLFGITTLGVAAVLAGCPIYSSNGDYSGNYRVCNSNGCFDCPDNTSSGACVPWPCNSDADCGNGSTCSAGTCGPGPSGSSGTSGTSSGSSGSSGSTGSSGASGADGKTTIACVAPAGCPSGYTCGYDGYCYTHDCGGDVGCISPYTCKLVSGTAQCVSSPLPDASLGSDGEAAGALPDSGAIADAATSSDASVSSDASTALDAMMSFVDAPFVDAAPLPGAPCNADAECGDAGANSRCIDGQCVSQSDLCSDGTQCVVSGDSCVDGICTPPCSASAPCAAGFACDFTRNVCSENPRVCASNTDCLGGTTCVEGHCAAPCGTSDAAPACPSDQVCVNGGCIPDQRAAFTCFNDGVEGPLANHCDSADICLHHDCYVACDLTSDASPCGGGTVCKDVTVAAGTFAVCGTATTLGSQCDTAAARTCPAGAECVNGYCE